MKTDVLCKGKTRSFMEFMSARLSGEGTKGVVKYNGGIPRRWPHFPPRSSVLTADLPSVHGVVPAWDVLTREDCGYFHLSYLNEAERSKII